MDREAGWLQSMGSQRVRHDWVTEQQTFEYSSEGLKLKLQYFGHLMRRANSFEKTLMPGKISCWAEKGATEDEMVEWHHYLNGREFEPAPGDSEGQGSLASCSPWVSKSQMLLSN